MLWLHEVIVADVVYPAVLLVYGRPLGLLLAMVGCLQSGLQILCRSFCNVVAEEDREGNVVVGPDGEPRMDTKFSHRVVLYVPHGMVRYALPVPDVSGAVI